MRLRNRLMALAIIALAAALLIPGFAADDSSALQVEIDGVTITFEEKRLEIPLESDGSKKLSFFFYNTEAEPKVISTTVLRDAEYTTSSVSKDIFQIEAGKTFTVDIDIKVDRYAKTGDYPAQVKFNTVGLVDYETTVDFTVRISSVYDGQNMFNTLLGLVENPLPEPFDTPIWAALASFILWMIGAYIAVFILLHIVFGHILLRKQRDVAEDLRKDLGKLLVLALAVYGLSICMGIAGVSEYLVSLASSASQVLYLVIGAVMSWRLYKVLVRNLLKTHKKTTIKEFSGVDETLIPLFFLIGKLLIGTIATAAILAVLGFNFMAILTGAGIMGIALSLGAQSTLNQFFSGLNLLITRPFNPGDRVRLNNDEVVLIVRRVGLMNTTFESWYNAELFTMPNSKVVDSTIINITSENSIYKVLLFFNVDFDSNLDLVKELMLEAAMEHPRVIKDGSYEVPKTRVISLDEYSVLMRLTAYVDDFEDYGSIGGEIREAVFKKFRKEGVVIPFRKMDVRIVREEVDAAIGGGRSPGGGPHKDSGVEEYGQDDGDWERDSDGENTP